MGTFIVFGNARRNFPRMVDAIRKVGGALPGPVWIQAGCNAALFAEDSHRYEVFEYCSIQKFEEYVRRARLIICHGGVGVITAAIREGKRPAVFVRRASLGEHIDDHQSEWAMEIEKKGAAAVVSDTESLAAFVAAGLFHLEMSERSDWQDIAADVLRVDVQQYIRGLLGR